MLGNIVMEHSFSVLCVCAAQSAHTHINFPFGKLRFNTILAYALFISNISNPWLAVFPVSFLIVHELVCSALTYRQSIRTPNIFVLFKWNIDFNDAKNLYSFTVYERHGMARKSRKQSCVGWLFIEKYWLKEKKRDREQKL